MENKEKKLYTKAGDKGLTNLTPSAQVSKADERISAIGGTEEVISALGMVRVVTACPIYRGKLERIMKTLKTLGKGLADARSGRYAFSEEEITFLEQDMDKMLSKMPEGIMDDYLPGGCEQSARLDVAYTTARACERAVVAMDRRYAVPEIFKQYINRLCDYLLVSARYSDHLNGQQPADEAPVISAQPAIPASVVAPTVESVVNQVMARLGGAASMDLTRAKKLIAAVEQRALETGKQAVIAVVNAAGNPVAVHVMDGAFLVSYEVAVKKAYTAVAVKMPTMELNKLVQPGGTFYGLQSLEGMVTFGGGVPITVGGVIVGGLGVSGGTGEEDHALCQYGLSVFESL
ncbi:MAG: cob(I)yrinic acid a,c-diamide adenosyltransferase [Clostridia bacterium]|nr:cob(I)yrinic acid a,c-diamide adenosyltransferase [Clostridia bacterium]